MRSESELQRRDIVGIFHTQGDRLDVEYIERWLDELGVRNLWEKIRK